MKINNISVKTLFLVNCFLLFLIFGFLLYKMPKAFAQESYSDAIAVRVIPNPNHFSAQRWYQSQGFTGSPQSLIVDGYKAVRDGRTVYVSAANVLGNNLYTNIYLISYDQGADPQTVDIFGRVLKNWKFNINLNNDFGHCFISNQTCYENSDCPSGYVCGNNVPGLELQLNKCVLPEVNYNQPENTPACLLDSDCPGLLSCSSLKSKLIRDLDRLEKLVSIKEVINTYNQNNGRYPVLGSGTYLPHVAISTWPSWNNVFLSQISVSGAFDPINKLGTCADNDKKFNLDTCWNAVDNVFYSFSPPAMTNFILPANSYAIAYVTNSNGSDYKLCATMETVLGGNNYNITDGALANHACSLSPSVGQIGLIGFNINNAPIVSEYFLEGQSGQEFQGFIKASDSEGHPINWIIIPNFNFVSLPPFNIPFPVATNFSSWTPASMPTMVNTNNPNQKMLWAEKAGNPGVYPIKVFLSDNIGSTSEQVLNINITNPEPQIIAGNVLHNLSYYNDFNNEVSIKTHNQISSVKVCLSDSGGSCLSQEASLPISLSCSPTSIAAGSGSIDFCVYDLSGGDYLLKMNSNNLSIGNFYYKITAIDSYNTSAIKIFKVDVTANNPVVVFNNCPIIANLGDSYECEIRTINPLENAVISVISSLPNGLLFDSGDNKIKGYLLEIVTNFEIKAVATNEFNLSAENNFFLNITSSCGSHLVQYEGGPWNSSGTIRNHQGFYKTVLVGNQCWLKDNLNVGVQVPTSTTSFNNNIIEKYCYDSNSINCDIYGGLYRFAEALNLPDICNNQNLPNTACVNYAYKGACPDGWRVPIDSDWYILENYLKDTGALCSASRAGTWECSSAGSKLKMGGSSNFNALLIGSYSFGGIFSIPFNKYANFWSANYQNASESITRHIDRDMSEVQRAFKNKTTSYSVRCIKDSNQCQNNPDCQYLGSGFVCSQGICVFDIGGGPSNNPGSNQNNNQGIISSTIGIIPSNPSSLFVIPGVDYSPVFFGSPTTNDTTTIESIDSFGKTLAN